MKDLATPAAAATDAAKAEALALLEEAWSYYYPEEETEEVAVSDEADYLPYAA